MTSVGLRACAELIAGLWPDPIPPRCGIAVCGGTRLGIGSYWPLDPWTVPAYCNVARCGASFCGRIIGNDALFAGMLPVMYSHHVTLGLTEILGGPADPRQVYAEAFDNPGMTLHIVGDDLSWLDAVAEHIIGELDRTAHVTTAWGTVNGLRIDPPRRTTRKDRPRYDVQINIDMELIR